MDDQQLRKLLEELQSEIEQAQSVDEKGRELLRHLDADIHELLDRSEDASMQAHPSMIERLQDSVDHFEVSHPLLTTMLSQILNALNTAGI